jgi:Predicted transcriptional regulators
MTWPGGSASGPHHPRVPHDAPAAPARTAGRLGLYGDRHVQRLRLIIRLQRRGYSLAGIRDLLAAWESGTDLVTLLGVDESQAALDETPLWLTRAELLQRLPALDEATLARAGRIGLVRPHGEDHFGVRSPALLGLVADWVRAGVPPGEALDLIEVFVGDLDTLAGKLAEIVARIWEPLVGRGPGGRAARPAPARSAYAAPGRGQHAGRPDRRGAGRARRYRPRRWPAPGRTRRDTGGRGRGRRGHDPPGRRR